MSGAPVEFADDEPSGLASLVGGLIESNLERAPGRRRLLRPARVGIVAPDADVSVTLLISRGRVRVANGIATRTLHLLLRADAATLLGLTSAPLRLGFPDPLTPEGRRVIVLMLTGRLRVRGALLHPRRMARLARLLAV